MMPETRGRAVLRKSAMLVVAVYASATIWAGALAAQSAVRVAVDAADVKFNGSENASAFDLARSFTRERLDLDFAAMSSFRPSYPFWRHIFSIPDGSIAFGDATTGELLVVFPSRGDWTRNGKWEDPSLSSLLAGQRLQTNTTRRREQVAELLSSAVGSVVHNATRGNFVAPNARRYGGFLSEWGEIYERFGVPAEIGLAQALVESGLSGTIRSEARALGFCQWLPRNWDRLKRLAHTVIEGYNQTTQAAYCAAYLSVLATKYGTFIPALSEHHSGGANVGRTVINGSRLGAADVRDQYLLGSAFARDLRTIAPGAFSDVVRTYGPRSFLYSEMVFGNTLRIRELIETVPQERIYAMRPTRAIPIDEVVRRTGLSVDEVRRFNPALSRQVPAGANLYLPRYVEAFGKDVTFWHRPPPEDYAKVLYDFVRLDASLVDWEDPWFDEVLKDFERRFRATDSEEGHIMATVLRYVMEELGMSRPVLAEYRTSPRIQELFERGVRERETSAGLAR